MELVERWWNGQWGRLARLDARLSTMDGRWRVERLEGGVDAGRVHVFVFPDEGAAREKLDEVLRERGRWKRLSV